MKNHFTHGILFSLLFITLNLQAQSPRLNSYTAAQAVIFLDFDGHTVTGTTFNLLTQGNPIECSGSGLNNSQTTTIFNRVSEDFRPFNVNVTTDSTVFLAAPLNRRMRVIFTTSWEWYAAAGGVALPGTFTDGSDSPCFVFTSILNNNVKAISDAASHETGHTLGLNHQTAYDNNCNLLSNYYGGRGTGEIGWAPIMGVGYYQNTTRWYNGTSLGCNTIQDDLSIITSGNGFGYRRDDYGNTFDDAATAEFTDQQLTKEGIIEKNGDADIIKFALTTRSRIQLDATPFNVGANNAGANIDLQLSLYNEARTLIKIYNPADLLSASADTIINAGIYFIKLEGKGNIYAPDYASIGSYTLKVKTSRQDVLPLRLLKLNGNVSGNKHQLQWIIDADENVTAQVLEVSSDGVHFTTITQPAVNDRNYIYQPVNNTNVQYRLKAAFDNGKEYYSNIITLRKTGENRKPQLISTLVNNNTVAVSSPGTYQYQLYDMNGKIVRRGQLSNGYNTINTSGVMSGLYIMKFADEKEAWTEKIILN